MNVSSSQLSRSGPAVDEVLFGYARFVTGRVAEGWRPYLVTMMFRQMPGGTQSVLAQMRDEAERVYRTFVTRVVRRPLASSSIDSLPIVIAAPDLPVGKSGKPLADVAINDGLHLHGVLLVPARSRLRLPADEHFRTHQDLYVDQHARLARVDVRPIDADVERVVEYSMKSVRRRRFTLDDILVLPRTRSELA